MEMEKQTLGKGSFAGPFGQWDTDGTCIQVTLARFPSVCDTPCSVAATKTAFTTLREPSGNGV